MARDEDFVRAACEDDISSIKRIETICGLSSWTEDDYRCFLDPTYGILLVSIVGDDTGAFISVRLITKPKSPTYVLTDKTSHGNIASSNLHPSVSAKENESTTELEICNIGVLPKYRRQQHARNLVDSVIAETKRPARMFLEVRESNFEAISFYKKMDFEVTGKRKNYYKSPSESALVMQLALK